MAASTWLGGAAAAQPLPPRGRDKFLIHFLCFWDFVIVRILENALLLLSNCQFMQSRRGCPQAN
jgi:hypothetical protein